MSGVDSYGDPIPPGHAEPRIHADGKVYETADVIIPFDTGPAWRPAPLPRQEFSVPLCGRCCYYHHPEEACRR